MLAGPPDVFTTDAMAVVEDPSVDLVIELIGGIEAEQLALLDERAVQIEPAELLSVIHDSRIKAVLLDVRDERYYNQFHIQGARHLVRLDVERAQHALIHAHADFTKAAICALELSRILHLHDDFRTAYYYLDEEFTPLLDAGEIDDPLEILKRADAAAKAVAALQEVPA